MSPFDRECAKLTEKMHVEERSNGRGIFNFHGRVTIRNSEELFALIKEISFGKTEKVVVFFVNSSLELLHGEITSSDCSCSAVVDLGQIIARGRLLRAAGFFLAHNHPSGICRPSKADVALTRRIAEASDLCDMPLLCHVVVTDTKMSTVGYW